MSYFSEDIKSLHYKVLLKYWANCKVTYAMCTGHHKSGRNQSRIDAIEAELAKRNIPVPCDDVGYAFGKFNGEGSY